MLNTIPKEMLYWNHDHTQYAILISPRYGAGWSTWNDPKLAYDKNVVKLWLKTKDNPYTGKVFVKNELSLLGYKDVYLGDYSNIEVIWIHEGDIWRITEYDGAESIEFLESEEYYYA